MNGAEMPLYTRMLVGADVIKKAPLAEQSVLIEHRANQITRFLLAEIDSATLALLNDTRVKTTLLKYQQAVAIAQSIKIDETIVAGSACCGSLASASKISSARLIGSRTAFVVSLYLPVPTGRPAP